MLTVYQNAKSVRVVMGAHKPHAGSKSYRIAVYGNEATAPAMAAKLALANENDASVRAAIERIAPAAEAELCKGYELRTWIGDVCMSTLFAVFPDGRMFRSDQHPLDSFFDRAGRTWTRTHSASLIEAEFIGNYAKPAV